jgi:hypothetical protein
MNLKGAASYFARTQIDGWNGSDWDLDIARGAYLPFDRFISEREFGNKRRHLLCNPDSSIPEDYKVVRLNDEIFLLGVRNDDRQGSVYSHVFLLHRAPFQADLMEYTKTTAASGVAGSAVKTSVGVYHCDAERMSYMNSREFDAMRFSEMQILLPSNCPATIEHELKIGDYFYEVEEVFPSSGFVACRAVRKK